MRNYEVVYIFRPELESEEVDAKLEGYHDRFDGEVTAVEHWGTRQLAYEIAGERSGYYVVAQYEADPSSLDGFEQGLKHDEELIRHLVVLAEGELPAPPSERDAAEEEDEEEGGDEAETEADEAEDEGDDEGEEDADEGDDEAEDEEGDEDDEDADDEEEDEDEEDDEGEDEAEGEEE